MNKLSINFFFFLMKMTSFFLAMQFYVVIFLSAVYFYFSFFVSVFSSFRVMNDPSPLVVADLPFLS